MRRFPQSVYRADIDGLRAVAVLSVVLSHAGIPGFSGGFVGVDIFFVISGFLITQHMLFELSENRFSLREFYARRILPALFAMLAVLLVAGYAILSPFHYESLAKSAFTTLIFASNFWFLQSAGSYFGNAAELEILLHTWSLAVEEQFYLFSPLLVIFLFKAGRKTLFWGISALCVLSMGVAVWMTSAHPTAGFFLIPSRIWEFGLGMLIAMGALPRTRNVVLLETLACLGAGLICASVLFLDPTSPFPGVLAVPVVVGTSLVIWCGQNGQTCIGRILSMRVVVGIGLISYSLYLWHWPPLVFARILRADLHIPLPLACGLVAVSFGCAYLSWRFIERPFRRGSTSYRTAFVWSFAGTACLLVCALFIQQTDGIKSRAPEAFLAQHQQAKNRAPIDVSCMQKGKVCFLGNTVDETTPITHFVWGDSHAAALSPGFDSWFKQENIAGAAATKSACPPLLGLIRLDLPKSHRCSAFNQSILRYLEESDTIENVFLVGRWALAANGTRAAGEPGAITKLGPAGGDEGAVVDAGDVLFEKGLDATIQKLHALGKSVTIIESIPEMGYNVPEVEMQSAFLMLADPHKLHIDAYTLRNQPVTAALEKMQNQYGITVASVSKTLCQPECLTHIGSDSLYRDDDHLSSFGAKWLLHSILEGD